MSRVEPTAEPRTPPKGGSGASDARPSARETRELALHHAVTLEAVTGAYNTTRVISMARIFEGYLNGDEPS